MAKIVDIATAQRKPQPKPHRATHALANRFVDGLVGALASALVSGVLGLVWAGSIHAEQQYWQRWVAGDIANADRTASAGYDPVAGDGQ